MYHQNLYNYLLIIIAVIVESCNTGVNTPKTIPVDIKMDFTTIQRFGDFKAGDNWCQTWAADDNIYTMLDDGFGFNESTIRYNSVPVRISGSPNDSLKMTELSENYPLYEFGEGFYGYGIISVDKVLYTFVSLTNTNGFNYFHGNKLFYSKDFGETWYNHTGNPAIDEKYDTTLNKVFFWHEDPVTKDSVEGYAFSWVSFCQNGKDNAHANEIDDPYVYLFCPEPDECWQLNMARVKKGEILNKSAYEYFQEFNIDNEPIWTNDITQRGVLHEFPNNDKWGWYSWLPSVVWNKGLGLYIMVNYGKRSGTTQGRMPGNYWNNYMHDETGSIGFWYAENPWGPWEQIYYQDYFHTGDPTERNYQMKLNPKWIENDGQSMYLIWSDSKDSWTTNYLWNQMKIDIILK